MGPRVVRPLRPPPGPRRSAGAGTTASASPRREARGLRPGRRGGQRGHLVAERRERRADAPHLRSRRRLLPRVLAERQRHRLLVAAAGFPFLVPAALGRAGRRNPAGPPDLPTFATDWSRDGKRLLYSESNPKTSWDIWVLPPAGASPPPSPPPRRRSGTPASLLTGAGLPTRFNRAARWRCTSSRSRRPARVAGLDGGGRQPAWSPAARNSTT